MDNQKTIQGTLFSKDPYIIYLLWVPREDSFGFDELQATLSGKKAYFLLNVMWSVEAPWDSQHAADWVSKRVSYSEHRIIFMCNSKQEVSALLSKGLEAHLVHQNSFVDPLLFSVQHETKVFSAIYNAAIASYKRHELIRDIPGKVGLVTRAVDRDYYIDKVHPLKNIEPINFNEDCHVRWVNKDELNKYYSQSFCGLCLSAKEGAMWAAIEYLLCGIPVVTTPALGGRDYFFNPLNSILVDDDSEAIAQGVKVCMERHSIPGLAEQIRVDTIKRQLAGIETLKTLIACILLENRIYLSAELAYTSSYCNALRRQHPAKLFIDKEVERLHSQ